MAALRKAPAAQVARLGSYRWHLISHKPMWNLVLRWLQQTAPTEPLFPDYNYSTASSFVKAYADAHGWNQSGAPVIDGTHCIRHGAATDILKQAVRYVLTTGAWESVSGARNYTHFGDRHTLIRKDVLRRAKQPVTVSAWESAQQVRKTIKDLRELINKR